MSQKGKRVDRIRKSMIKGSGLWKGIVLIFLGYLVEGIIIWIWYNCILSKELKSKNIVSRSINIFLTQRKNLYLHILGRGKSEEQDTYFHWIKNNLFILFENTVMLAGFVFIVPLVLVFFLDFKDNRISSKGVVYLFFVVGVIYKRLKTDTQNIVVAVNSYIQKVMIPLEKNPDLLSVKENQESLIINKRKLIIVFLMFAVVMVVGIPLAAFLEKSKAFQRIGVVAAIIILIWEFGTTLFRKKTLTNVREEIEVEGYILENLKNEIEGMCTKLKILSLKCQIIDTQARYVKSKINENGAPQIDISNGFIDQIYCCDDAKATLLFTIAHELGHIYYNDFDNIKKRVARTNCLYIVLVLLNVIGIMVFIKSTILVTVVMFVMLIEGAFEMVIGDPRYWKQIAELRADRVAINVCECDSSTFVAFWRKECKSQDIKRENVLLEYYRKYIKIEGHPSMDRRMDLIKRKSRWQWWEYIEHALIIMKWRITNRGWNGR